MSDLYSSTNIKPFASLQAEYELPTSEQFNYVRITSYFKSKNTLRYGLFWRIYPTSKRKPYHFLYNKFILKKTNSILTWERDLNTSFSDEQWSKALQHAYSATKCTKLRELSHKVTQRQYLTTYRIAKFDSSTILQQVTGLPIQFSSSLALLNVDNEDIPSPDREFATHLFLATKLGIPRLWRSPTLYPLHI